VRVLAVDTTTPRGSVAVVSEEGTLGEARVVTGDGHSRWLLLAVDALLRGVGSEPAALDAFAVTCGPGSFTGLRIALSSIQGLALACARPCVGISTLDVLALSAAGAGGPIIAVMDAFRGETYVAVYDEAARPLGDPRVGVLEEVASALPDGAVFVGDAALSQRSRIEALVPGARFPQTDLFLAAAVGRAALERVRKGDTVTAAQLRPLYLRGAGVASPRP
jgi:tRNA threonylcarbamoyladenosine biosynthesis protein TsaB